MQRVEKINIRLKEVCGENKSTGQNNSSIQDKAQINLTTQSQTKSSYSAQDDECGSLYVLAQNMGLYQAKVNGLDKRITDLEHHPPSVERVSAETQEKLHNNLRVKEVAKQSSSQPDSTRTYYDLTFSICVQNENQCNDDGLENVVKVSYYFDPSWFSPSVRTTDNRTDMFAYQIQVWGRTKVTAFIYLKGESSAVVRGGLMSFIRARDVDVYWGPDTSKEGCANSS